MFRKAAKCPIVSVAPERVEKKTAVLGQLPDQPNAIRVRLPETQDPARAHVNACLADCSDGIQSFVVRTGGNNLDALAHGHLSDRSLACPYFGVVFS